MFYFNLETTEFRYYKLLLLIHLLMMSQFPGFTADSTPAVLDGPNTRRSEKGFRLVVDGNSNKLCATSPVNETLTVDQVATTFSREVSRNVNIPVQVRCAWYCTQVIPACSSFNYRRKNENITVELCQFFDYHAPTSCEAFVPGCEYFEVCVDRSVLIQFFFTSTIRVTEISVNKNTLI